MATTLVKQKVTTIGGMLAVASGFTFAWDAVTDEAFAGYRVYYGTSSGNYDQDPGAGIDVGTATSYDYSALSPGTYYFVVCWYDEFFYESEYSAEVTKIRT